MIGKTLGHYEILEPLGAGGMGEVYLGEDTRLGRKVAIKVLPAEFASDPERLARFEQEARAAAALNHPHIAVVHDIGTEGDTHFMVQEYLEGQSLRERLDKGALPLDKALDLAVEVGEALIAAHKAGIIHRDLKPDNIFVTGEGHAKVLDFGLAKLTEVAPASGSASMSPTMLGTVAGQVMGTAGYMAPEQIDGAELDQRADLFAFGCVLYGMVTGRQAFSGRNVHETLGRILSEEPTPIADLHKSVPQELQRIVRKALAKDADRRYQTAGDLSIDLRQLREDIVAGEVVPIGAPTDAGAATGLAQTIARKTSSAGLLAAAVVALLLGLALGWGVRGSPSGQPRLDLYLASGGVQPGLGQQLAISPDGSVVALVDETRLRFRRLGQDVWTDAAETSSVGVVVFSATGRSIYYTNRREVWRVELDGSPPQLVADLGFSPVAGWRRGSDELMFSGRAGGDGPRSLLVGVAPDRGEVTEVWSTAIDPEDGLLALFGRIDERRYLGMRVRGEDPVSSSIGIVDSESGEVGQWLQGYHAPRIAPDGSVLGADARGRLLSFAFADDGESLASATMEVIDGLWSEVPYAAYDVAENGTLALVAGNITSGVTAQRLVWYDAAGRIEEVPARGTTFENDTRLSPDGRFVALEAPFEGKMNVWIHDLGRDVTTPLAVDHPGAFPIWSPDGTEIIYHVDETEENQPGIYRVPVDRSAPPAMMLADPEGEFLLPMDWSPDGSTLLYARSPSRIRSAGSDLWTIPVDDGEPAPFIATPANEIDGRFSSDGRWIAYNSDYSGRYEVYIRPSGGGGEIPVSSSGGFNPEWHPLQPTLFFQAPRTDGEGSAVFAVDFTDGEPSAVREVAPIPARSSFLFIVARDGERFMTAVRGTAQDESPAHLRIVINPSGS